LSMHNFVGTLGLLASNAGCPFIKIIATVLSYNMALIITSIKPINPIVILPLSVLMLVLLLVILECNVSC